MKIEIIKHVIKLSEVRKLAQEFYKDMIKGAVDLEREAVALGGEYHIDASNVLMNDGSKQKDIWGFNINLGDTMDIEYTALINIRPSEGNRSMTVEDKSIREKMERVILEKIKND